MEKHRVITKNEADLIETIALSMAAEDIKALSPWSNLTEELKKAFGLKVSSGCYRTAFILDNVVVKVSKDASRIAELVSEAKFIQTMRKDKKYGRHFPLTEIFKVGNVTLQIQEKVNMSHKGTNWAMRDKVDDLAGKLGIEDCHEGNYGWKTGKNGKYPVFVDVDFRDSYRSVAKKQRSWF